MRILIVDDDAGMLNAIKVGLLSYGHEVRTARDGFGALEILRAHPGREERPEILLTDFRMPEMNGLDLIMSSRAIVPGMKAIIMTAYGDDSLRKSVEQLGGCAYVEKPFRPEALAGIIGQARQPSNSGTGV